MFECVCASAGCPRRSCGDPAAMQLVTQGITISEVRRGRESGMNSMETELQGNYSQFSGRMQTRARRAAPPTHAYQKNKKKEVEKSKACSEDDCPRLGGTLHCSRKKKCSATYIKQHLSSEMAANRNYGVFFPHLQILSQPQITAFKPGGLLSAARRERPFLNHINKGDA